MSISGINKKRALIIMIILLGIMMVFHLLVLIQLIPYDIVWAGKINSLKEMITFEIVSILINIVIFVVLLIKKKLISSSKKNKLIDFLIWLIFGLFTLNTVGNLFSKSKLELIMGTGLTAVLAVLTFIIAKKDKSINKN